MSQIKSVADAQVRGKRVLVRCDFDVPLVQLSTVNGQWSIADDSRLVSCISTIEYLLEEGATVIAVGHIGRPEGYDAKFSLSSVAQWFGKQFEREIESSQLRGFEGWMIKENFILLENLRFYKGEEENDPAFSEELASLADIYVNEAFGVDHRAHASIVGVPKLLPHFGGFHLLKEIKILSLVLNQPKRPLTIIVGGAKIETKLPLISKMNTFADLVLIGGELAEEAKVLAKVEHENIRGKKGKLIVADLIESKKDIEKSSLEEFEKVIKESGMIIWNGPMGEIGYKLKTKNEKLIEENEGFTTLSLAKAIIGTGAYTIVGGGDTVGFLNQHNFTEKFSFVSVGGGAMLEFLSGIELPGLIALEN